MDLNDIYTFSSVLRHFSNSSVICIVHIILFAMTKVFNIQSLKSDQE